MASPVNAVTVPGLVALLPTRTLPRDRRASSWMPLLAPLACLGLLVMCPMLLPHRTGQPSLQSIAAQPRAAASSDAGVTEQLSRATTKAQTRSAPVADPAIRLHISPRLPGWVHITCPARSEQRCRGQCTVEPGAGKCLVRYPGYVRERLDLRALQATISPADPQAIRRVRLRACRMLPGEDCEPAWCCASSGG